MHGTTQDDDATPENATIFHIPHNAFPRDTAYVCQQIGIRPFTPLSLAGRKAGGDSAAPAADLGDPRCARVGKVHWRQWQGASSSPGSFWRRMLAHLDDTKRSRGNVGENSAQGKFTRWSALGFCELDVDWGTDHTNDTQHVSLYRFDGQECHPRCAPYVGNLERE